MPTTSDRSVSVGTVTLCDVSPQPTSHLRNSQQALIILSEENVKCPTPLASTPPLKLAP